MAHGAPDWSRTVIVTFAEGQAADEYAAGKVGRYSGTATTYQEVAKWTVTTARTGELKEITVRSDNYAKTNLQITVGAVVFATEWLTQDVMPLVWGDLRLAAGAVVKVEAKSTDGTSIIVDAVITGKEIG